MMLSLLLPFALYASGAFAKCCTDPNGSGCNVTEQKSSDFFGLGLGCCEQPCPLPIQPCCNPTPICGGRPGCGLPPICPCPLPSDDCGCNFCSNLLSKNDLQGEDCGCGATLPIIRPPCCGQPNCNCPLRPSPLPCCGLPNCNCLQRPPCCGLPDCGCPIGPLFSSKSAMMAGSCQGSQECEFGGCGYECPKPPPCCGRPDCCCPKPPCPLKPCCDRPPCGKPDCRGCVQAPVWSGKPDCGCKQTPCCQPNNCKPCECDVCFNTNINYQKCAMNKECAKSAMCMKTAQECQIFPGCGCGQVDCCCPPRDPLCIGCGQVECGCIKPQCCNLPGCNCPRLEQKQGYPCCDQRTPIPGPQACPTCQGCNGPLQSIFPIWGQVAGNAGCCGQQPLCSACGAGRPYNKAAINDLLDEILTENMEGKQEVAEPITNTSEPKEL